MARKLPTGAEWKKKRESFKLPKGLNTGKGLGGLFDTYQKEKKKGAISALKALTPVKKAAVEYKKAPKVLLYFFENKLDAEEKLFIAYMTGLIKDLESREKKLKQYISILDKATTLPDDVIFGNEKIRNAFFEQTKKEFSQENVEFLEELKKLGFNPNDSKVSKAMDLLDKYIVSGAPSQVNIGSSEFSELVKLRKQKDEMMSEKIQAKKGQGKLVLWGKLCENLDKAKDAVYALLTRDTIPRWKRTDEFKAIFAKYRGSDKLLQEL